MNMGFGATQSEPAMEPCRHRGDWDRSVINGIVLLMCGECAFTKVLAEDLETGRLYWEEVPDEGDARLGGTDLAEAVPEVRGDEGEQPVQSGRKQGRRSRKLVQVVQEPGQEGETAALQGEPGQVAEAADYEVLPRVSAGEVAE